MLKIENKNLQEQEIDFLNIDNLRYIQNVVLKFIKKFNCYDFKEDILQEAIFLIYKNIKKYKKDKANLHTFMYIYIQKAFYQYYFNFLNIKFKNDFNFVENIIFSNKLTPEIHTIRDEIFRQIVSFLNTLNFRDKFIFCSVLNLIGGEKNSLRKIAKELNVSHTYVRNIFLKIYLKFYKYIRGDIKCLTKRV
ncbi:MAG: sigma-70 family RNA polymerase sigma factor [Candidatus Goldbacteria bacterium]|nr:sigma-70 family RNA polymerase sigma factor [Candidatus Goldiibacteriota bacterium]